MIEILIIIILVLGLLIYMKRQENFYGMNSVMAETGLDKTEILDSVKSFASNPNINITGTDVDDDIITNFILRQMGQEENPPQGSVLDQGSLLDLPDEPPAVNETSKLEDIDKVKLSYENLIEMKSNNQSVKLNNIFLELEKINKLDSPLKCK